MEIYDHHFVSDCLTFTMKWNIAFVMVSVFGFRHWIANPPLNGRINGFFESKSESKYTHLRKNRQVVLHFATIGDIPSLFTTHRVIIILSQPNSNQPIFS